MAKGNTNALLAALRENDAAKGKKADHYYEPNASIVSYPTGFPTLDYKLGYRVNVFDEDGKIRESRPCLGITAGSFVMFIGKPSTSKTATAIKVAANIVRQFDCGTVIHYDFEQALNYTRIQSLTKFKISDMEEKYILRQEKCTLDDMKKAIVEIYREKTSHPEKYKYNAGVLNEFGEEIVMYQPTVMILDSIATITSKLEGNDKKTIEKMEAISSQTDATRMAGEISRFFKEIMAYLREANIILIGINQIKTKLSMNSFIPQPAEIIGLKQDEALPGGNAPSYLSHILLKFTSIGSKKYNEEDDGFNGFQTKVDIIKSRVSRSINNVNLVYDMNSGIDMVRSTFEFCNDNGMIGGNKNGYYFLSDPDVKFTRKNMNADFRKNPNLYSIMHKNIIPMLDRNLSGIRPEEMEVPDEEINFYNL